MIGDAITARIERAPTRHGDTGLHKAILAGRDAGGRACNRLRRNRIVVAGRLTGARETDAGRCGTSTSTSASAAGSKNEAGTGHDHK